MARIFAEFEELISRSGGKLVRRRDTRIYFGDHSRVTAMQGRCVGAFYLQNPGSAGPTSEPTTKANGAQHWPWDAIDYSQENLMPMILRILSNVLELIGASSPQIAEALLRDAYIQLLNLSYIRNPANASLALQQWREVIALGNDRDDVPCESKHLRFVAFGWSDKYRASKDGQRVSQTLLSFLSSSVWLLFPAGNEVRSDAAIKRELAGETREAIQGQIKQGNSYPTGGLHERKTFPLLYQTAVSRVLSEILSTAEYANAGGSR